jgi:arylformamidase
MASRDRSAPCIGRRAVLAAGATLVATPVLAQPDCTLGVPEHERGPTVFGDYDQVELDVAYDQDFYQAHIDRTNQRLNALSYLARTRLGDPERAAYGEAQWEGMDIYRTSGSGRPVFVFIHGGTWRYLNAAIAGFAAEMFVDAGAHYVALDFADVRAMDGDLGALAAQVRNGIAWVAHNAESFGGDPARIYVGGHSSGGHLCAVALVTDWEQDHGLPADVIKGGLCMSGIYDLAPVRLSWRRSYIAFTDAMEAALSPQRHVARVRAPLVVSCGSYETPEFQRQAREFVAAATAAGKAVTLVQAPNFHHQDMWESLGNPYGPNGRAALAMMGLGKGGSSG